jgi:hypothetical protein
VGRVRPKCRHLVRLSAGSDSPSLLTYPGTATTPRWWCVDLTATLGLAREEVLGAYLSPETKLPRGIEFDLLEPD